MNEDCKLRIAIPRHIESGQVIRYVEKGHIGKDKPGDLILHIHIKPHSSFIKEGLDVVFSLEIDMVQAALGCVAKVKTIYDETVELQIKPGVSHGEVLYLKGKV